MESSYSESQPYRGKEFAAVLAAMSPSQLRSVLKDAYRREAKAVKQVAKTEIAATGMRHAASVGNSLRTRVYSRGSDFMVSAVPKGHQGSTANGFHKTRAGQWKPIVKWMNEGTDSRRVRTWRKVRVNFGGRGRNAKWRTLDDRRGKLKALHYVEKSESKAVPMVESDMASEIERAVVRRLNRGGIVTG